MNRILRLFRRPLPFAPAFALGVIAGMVRQEIAEDEHWAPWIAEACSEEAARIANAMAAAAQKAAAA